jgi:hypothetical protein
VSGGLPRALRFAHLCAYRIWIGLLAVKVAIVIALLGIIALDAVIQRAHAATVAKPPMAPKERAYTLTLMCIAVAANDRNEEDGIHAMDAARKMGRAMRYSEKRVSDDIWTMTNVVGDQLHRDPTSIDSKREICRKIQLAS